MSTCYSISEPYTSLCAGHQEHREEHRQPQHSKPHGHAAGLLPAAGSPEAPRLRRHDPQSHPLHGHRDSGALHQCAKSLNKQNKVEKDIRWTYFCCTNFHPAMMCDTENREHSAHIVFSLHASSLLLSSCTLLTWEAKAPPLKWCSPSWMLCRAPDPALWASRTSTHKYADSHSRDVYVSVPLFSLCNFMKITELFDSNTEVKLYTQFVCLCNSFLLNIDCFLTSKLLQVVRALCLHLYFIITLFNVWNTTPRWLTPELFPCLSSENTFSSCIGNVAYFKPITAVVCLNQSQLSFVPRLNVLGKIYLK